jgi:hypothetical protein
LDAAVKGRIAKITDKVREVQTVKLVALQDFVLLGTPPALLIDKVLPEKSLMILVGEPYVGKSLIALELAVSVALGAQALGKFQAQQRNVVYVAADAPTWYGAWQASSLLRGHGYDENLPGGRMWFAPPGQGLRVLESDEACKQFIERVDELEVQLVVLDTLRKMHTHNENDSGFMTQVVDRCRMMNEAGMAVILVHHASKGTGDGEQSAAYRGRGSSVVPGEVDINWLVEKRPQASRVQVAKGRGASLEGPFDVRLQSTGPPDRPALTVQWAIPEPDLPQVKPEKPARQRRKAAPAEPQWIDPE